MSELRVTEISIYPIKSTAGIRLDECSVEPHGLAMDRRWVVVDEQGETLTAREYPILTQVRSQVLDDGLRLQTPGRDDIFVPFADGKDGSRLVRVWGDEVRAVSAGTAVDAWFTDLLGAPCHLSFMHDTRQRLIDYELAQPGDRLSFADAYPLLLISEASLADLNSRLDQTVTMRNFRPNIVIEGCDAYAEDNWQKVRIGTELFDGAENCLRCVFTTIDPDTAVKHPNLEPLRTLGSYRRKSKGGVPFGCTLIPRSAGTVRVGDSLRINDDV